MTEPRHDDHSIPIIEEEAFVEKRQIDLEQVSVRTSVAVEDVVVRDSVSREQVEIRRVRVDREVDRAPDVHEQDGVTIIPVLEERLVVEKRLFLVEEIHIVRSSTDQPVELPATLRRTQVDIDRTDLTNNKEDIHGRTR